MNLEIANRLVALRKENGLSQEALAEKLGISRQAVSKWERAEASPDTDNLIALARLYHISLDELLKIHEEDNDVENDLNNAVGHSSGMNNGAADGAYTQDGKDGDAGGAYRQTAGAGADGTSYGFDEKKKKDDVHIGFDGIHVRDKNGDEVHVSWQGIHIHDRKNENEVHIDENGIYVNGDEAKDHIFTHGKDEELPIGIIAIVAYIVIGCFFNLWHPGWLIFFLVPIISTLIRAVRHRNANLFAYPVLATLVFLYAGLVRFVWHPTWVVFLTIPLYYSLVGYIRRETAREDRTDV